MPLEETKSATILIVDDNPTNLRVLMDHLKASGLKILVARSGEGALQQVEYARPDVILLDVMMPGMNGFETCRRLKALDAARELPVIFMTALTETVDKLKGFEAGGVDYITKPLQHEEVLARVKTHLTIRKLQQQLQEQNLALLEKNVQLQELNASKDKFFSIIAHDLRSPLSGLLALIRLTAEQFEKYTHDEARQVMDALREESEDLYKLLENLLTWATIQRGRIPYQPKPIALPPLIERNLRLFAPNAAQKQITLTNAAPSPLPAYADADMVDAILRNLLSNAVKFTKAQGTITISATRREQEVEVAVADTGVGMSPEQLAQLFRIDAKHHALGTAGEKGTGLGLNLCKELVEKNGGRIWAESEIGQGSVFRFTLPQSA